MPPTANRPAVPDLLKHEEDEGFEAFVCGAGQLDNPHHEGTLKHAAWLQGWQEAKTYHE